MRVIAHEHNYVWRQALDGEDQSMHYGTCNSPYCTDNDLLVKPHTKGNQKIVVEATEENPTGTISYTCEECGYTWTEEYHYSAKPVIGHAIIQVYYSSENIYSGYGFVNEEKIGTYIDNFHFSGVRLLIGAGVDISKVEVRIPSWGNVLLKLEPEDISYLYNASDFKDYTVYKMINSADNQLFTNSEAITITYDGEEIYSGKLSL